MITVPSETSIIEACADVIKATIVEGNPIKAKIIPRWILGFTPKEAVDMMIAPNDSKKIHAWVLTMQSWIETRVKSASGTTQTPKNWQNQMIGLPGFNGGSDPAENTDYKIQVNGVIKVYQIQQLENGSDSDNSEIHNRAERDAVKRAISVSPRLGLDWSNFDHDLLKFPAIVSVAMADAGQLHIAPGTLPFSFQYVAKA
jgi:hypothetical protein